MTWPNLHIVTVDSDPVRAYPRLEFARMDRGFWAVTMLAAQHAVPIGDLRPSWDGLGHERPVDDVFVRLREATQGVLEGDPLQGTSMGSLVAVSFHERRGHALGSFCVYAFRDGRTEVLYDATVGTVEGFPPEVPEHLRRLCAVRLTPRGVEGSDIPTAFSFAEAEHLVISSTPLHTGPSWPPADPRDTVRMTFDTDTRRDRLVALWSRDASA